MPQHARTRLLFSSAAVLGLVALETALFLRHDGPSGSTVAGEPEPGAERAAADDLAALTREGDRAWLVDLVEPDDGEGGSEEGLAAFVQQIDARDDVDLTLSGYYGEGEHLFRATGSPGAIARLRAELEGHAWVEGLEPEQFYAIPDPTPADPDVGDVDRFALAGRCGLPDAPEADDPPEMHKPAPGRFEPNDPLFGLQWHMEQIHAPEAWTETRGEGAIVAVIDTGVAWRSAKGYQAVPDLAGTRFVEGASFVDGSSPWGLDDHAHGTHVAGTIAQTTHNEVGVTGVAFGSTIMPLKVLAGDGRGSVAGIANAIRYAADHGAHVINMSLGGPLPSSVLKKAIDYAYEKGVTVVAAAGNERRSRVSYPAANDHVIAVGSVDYNRELAFYSNWGKKVDITAPGGDTRVDKNGDGHPDGVLQNTIAIQRPLENDYLWFQGTSMASPHAAGVAALIVASGVTRPDEVERILKSTAVHPKGAKWDERFGAGIIDAARAVAEAERHYAPERTGVLGFLAFLALFAVGRGGSGLFAGIQGMRGRVVAAVAGVGAATWAAGVMGTPAAYALSASGASLGVSLASGLWLSAAVPAATAVLFLGVVRLRAALAGFALGYAALLLHGAAVLPTLLTEVPGGPAIDRLWLATNALLSAGLALRIVRLPGR